MSSQTRNLAWVAVMIGIVVVMVIGVVRADDGPRTDADRAFDLKETTLCPSCDGQNVLESNAPIATSIRSFIDELVAEGDTDEEIRAELAALHGDDVNAIPPATGLGSLVWSLPVVAVVLALAGLVLSFRRWSAAAAVAATTADHDLVAAAAAARHES